uniref:hypothetical protein n=1 Tax=Microcystis aeruginosa TaxID=1126 RepID=UPI00186965F3|nr:hypothetical protein [Microcystis aeruginosa]
MPVQTLEIPTEESWPPRCSVQLMVTGKPLHGCCNGPATRAEWGSREPLRQTLQQQRRSFVAVIDQADLTAEQRTALIRASPPSGRAGRLQRFPRP